MAGLELGRLAGENSLVFSSLEFLFRFLPVFLAAFYLTPPKYRNVTLSVGSILLYACAQPRYVLLLVSVTVLNYLIGIRAGTAARIRHRRRRQLAMLRWLFLAVAVDLGILVFFKAAGAAAGNLLLPLGLSFYTFKLVSYQADVYRARIAAETSFWRFTAYICMFPQITNGPIMRYEDAQEGLVGGLEGAAALLVEVLALFHDADDGDGLPGRDDLAHEGVEGGFVEKGGVFGFCVFHGDFSVARQGVPFSVLCSLFSDGGGRQASSVLGSQ